MRLLRRGDRASTLDLLVVGLGNPGREHQHDRHNAGWMVVDELTRQTRRLLPRQVLREARRDPRRRRQAGAAQARDVHEPLRPVARRRSPLLQGHAGADPRRPRRGRPRARPPAGAARRRPRRAQRASLPPPDARLGRLPPAPGRRRPAGARRPAAGRGLRALAVRARRGRRGRSSRAPPTRSRRSSAMGSTALRPSSTRGEACARSPSPTPAGRTPAPRRGCCSGSPAARLARSWRACSRGSSGCSPRRCCPMRSAGRSTTASPSGTRERSSSGRGCCSGSG